MSKILLLLEFPTINGGENSLLALLPGLMREGYEFLAVAPGEGAVATQLATLGIKRLGQVPTAAQAAQPKRREQLAEFIRQAQPDCVHSNSLAMSRLAGPVTDSAGIRGIGHLRDMMRLSRRAIIDLSYNRRLLAVSQATRAWYAGQGLPDDRLFTLYNGVDTDRFQPRKPTGYLHQELGLDHDALLIATIGQVGIRKGVDVAIRCMPFVLRCFPHVHLLLIGERHSTKEEAIEYEQSLHGYLRDHGLQDHVHFLGRRNDIPRVLNELVLLLHLARQEPLGRVLLEAAASACCVLATSVGGTVEIFGDNPPSATLVPLETARPRHLARIITQLLSTPSDRLALGAAARQRVTERFNLPQAVVALSQHYAGI